MFYYGFEVIVELGSMCGKFLFKEFEGVCGLEFNFGCGVFIGDIIEVFNEVIGLQVKVCIVYVFLDGIVIKILVFVIMCVVYFGVFFKFFD